MIPPRRLRGLINGGNCCFINVVLQALLACESFRTLLYDCLDAPFGSLIHKFVRLTREMDGGHIKANGHGLVKEQQEVIKDSILLKNEPVVADWFYDVFPSSVAVGGGVTSTNKSKDVNGGPRINGLGSAGGSQEDAEEFLTFVLNALHEEMVEWETKMEEETVNDGDMGGAGNGEVVEIENRRINSIKLKKENEDDNVWTEMTRSGRVVEIRGGEFAQSGVTDIFGGALRNEVKRARGKPSVTTEPFFSLSLDIESGMIRDVEHALKAYFEPECLEGYAEQGANGEIRTVDARKHVLLAQCPQTLILHLKRFSHNSVTGALNKVGRNIMFPQVLMVPGKVMHNAASRWGNEDGIVYDLNAVVTHVGKELAGGHYTADVKLESDCSEGDDGKLWLFCDDSKIVTTSWQKVCRKQAYLLLYSRRKS